MLGSGYVLEFWVQGFAFEVLGSFGFECGVEVSNGSAFPEGTTTKIVDDLVLTACAIWAVSQDLDVMQAFLEWVEPNCAFCTFGRCGAADPKPETPKPQNRRRLQDIIPKPKPQTLSQTPQAAT